MEVPSGEALLLALTVPDTRALPLGGGVKEEDGLAEVVRVELPLPEAVRESVCVAVKVNVPLSVTVTVPVALRLGLTVALALPVPPADCVDEALGVTGAVTVALADLDAVGVVAAVPERGPDAEGDTELDALGLPVVLGVHVSVPLSEKVAV